MRQRVLPRFDSRLAGTPAYFDMNDIFICRWKLDDDSMELVHHNIARKWSASLRMCAVVTAMQAHDTGSVRVCLAQGVSPTCAAMRAERLQDPPQVQEADEAAPEAPQVGETVYGCPAHGCKFRTSSINSINSHIYRYHQKVRPRRGELQFQRRQDSYRDGRKLVPVVLERGRAKLTVEEVIGALALTQLKAS